MKLINSFLLIALLSLGAQAQSTKLCSLDTQFPDFCQQMKHLRATVNVVDGQRELMLVDYQFLGSLAASLIDNSKQLQKVVPAALADHNLGLQNIEAIAIELKTKAESRDPEALVTANTLRNQCISCHTSTNPSSGNWNNVFGFDWERISKDCNRSGRNPYLCKSMNSLITNYNHIKTAYVAKVENYAVTAAIAADMARVLKDLKVKNFNHLGEANRALAEAATLSVMKLAQDKNPAVFLQALNLTDTCMKCHSEVAIQSKDKPPMTWGSHSSAF